jgi:Rha family phage regulatory protein
MAMKPIPFDLGVIIKKDVPVVSSRKVAEVFGKRHDHVLRAIENLECSEEFTRLNFGVSYYKDSSGKRNKEYYMTRDGFTFLVMGFTGKKAAQFKEAYIRRFNEMEQQLRQRAIGKAIRRTLTDAIKESGLNTQLKGWAYKSITDLVYRVAIGCTAAQFRKMHGLDKDANIRDYLDTYQLARISQAEKLAQALTDAGADYDHIKAVLELTFARPVLVEAAGR